MEELHKIEKPGEKVYFIAYDKDNNIKSYGEVNSNQVMETICHRLEVFKEEEKPNLFQDEEN